MSDYPNSGILNPNKYWREGTKMPTHNGRGAVTCKHCQQETEFEIAAWRRNGGKLITLALTEKALAEKKRADAKAKKASQQSEPTGDDTQQQSSEAQPGDAIY